MKGERIKVKNIEEVKEILKREKKEDVVIKLILALVKKIVSHLLGTWN